MYSWDNSWFTCEVLPTYGPVSLDLIVHDPVAIFLGDADVTGLDFLVIVTKGFKRFHRVRVTKGIAFTDRNIRLSSELDTLRAQMTAFVQSDELVGCPAFVIGSDGEGEERSSKNGFHDYLSSI